MGHVVEKPDPNAYLSVGTDLRLERILTRENMLLAWKRAPKVSVGFVFKGAKIRWSEDAFREFKRRVKRLILWPGQCRQELVGVHGLPPEKAR